MSGRFQPYILDMQERRNNRIKEVEAERGLKLALLNTLDVFVETLCAAEPGLTSFKKAENADAPEWQIVAGGNHRVRIVCLQAELISSLHPIFIDWQLQIIGPKEVQAFTGRIGQPELQTKGFISAFETVYRVVAEQTALALANVHLGL